MIFVLVLRNFRVHEIYFRYTVLLVIYTELPKRTTAVLFMFTFFRSYMLLRCK